MDNPEDLNKLNIEQLQKMLMLLPGNMSGLSEIRDKTKGGLKKLIKILRNIPNITGDELNCVLKLPPERNIDTIMGEELRAHALSYYNIKSNLEDKDDDEIQKMIRRSRIWRSEEIERLKETKRKLETEMDTIEDENLKEVKQKEIAGIDESISIHREQIMKRNLLDGGGKKRRRKKQSKRRSKKRRSSKRRSKRRSKKY